jgi:hypothetical protein
VRRELLRLALVNSKRSIPLQLLALGIIVVLGGSVQATRATIVAALIGIAVAIWRFVLSRRFGHDQALSEAQIRGVVRGLEGNAALAGILWATCSLWIYPALKGTSATTYVVIAIGSVATAALFMALVGRSFQLLVSLSLGAFVVASLFIDEVKSLPVAALAGLLAVTMIRAGSEVAQTTTNAIRLSLERDLANADLLKAKVSIPGDDEPRNSHADEWCLGCTGPAAPLGTECRATPIGPNCSILRSVIDGHPQ